MKIIRDAISLCTDCMTVHETGDATSIDEYYGTGEHPGRGELREGAKQRMHEIETGLARLGRDLVSDWDSETGRGVDEFSRSRCECCGSRLGGARYQYAILGPDDPS